MSLDPTGWFQLLVLPGLLGAGLLHAVGVRPGSDRLAYAGWAWMAGLWAGGLVLFTWLWFSPDLDSGTAPALGMAALALGGFLLGRRRFQRGDTTGYRST